jgi:hypothetical protein
MKNQFCAGCANRARCEAEAEAQMLISLIVVGATISALVETALVMGELAELEHALDVYDNEMARAHDVVLAAAELHTLAEEIRGKAA